MEVLFELIVELVLDWTIYDTDDEIKMPRSLRIGLLILAVLVYIALIVGLVLLLINSDNTFIKVIIAGAVLFFVGMIISLWRRVMKARKRK